MLTRDINQPVTISLNTDLKIQVQAISEGALRIVANGEESAPSSLDRYHFLHPVTCTSACHVTDTETSIEIRHEAAQLRIDKQSGSLKWLTSDGSDLHGEILLADEKTGLRLSLDIHDEEALYGLGDVANTGINRLGSTAEIWVRHRTAGTPIPYVMSPRGWALLIAGTERHFLDIGHTREEELVIQSDNGGLDFILFTAPDLPAMLNRLTSIVGRPPLLPIWAYGLTYCGNIGSSEREVIDSALRFRQEGIPCDVFSLNQGWTEGSEEVDFSTNKHWHSGRFPTAAQAAALPFTFIDTLRKHGFKLSLLLYCDHDLTVAEELLADNPNAAQGETSPFWYTHLRSFVEQGVTSFRLSWQNQSQIDDQRAWHNGMTSQGLHNLYPLLLSKQMHNGYREQTGRRPAIQTVAGFTGIQQFAATASGNYDSRESAVVAMINLGLAGHAHATTDIDVGTREGIHSGFLGAWAHMDSRSFFRHPAFLTSELKGLLRRYARLRYQLFPYLYTAAYYAHCTGMPIVRAMPLQYPHDPQCRHLTTQYMLGDDLLVTVFTDRVYLPDGVWVDYWSGKRIKGPLSFTYSCPDHAAGPLFVREGAIIPMWPVMDFVGQKATEVMQLHVYPSVSRSFTLYEDDGESFDYEQQRYALTSIHCRTEEDRTILEIGKRSGTYAAMPERRSYELYIYAYRKPARIRISGEEGSGDMLEQKQNWHYDRKNGVIKLKVLDVDSERHSLRIEMLFWHADTRAQASQYPTNVAAEDPASSHESGPHQARRHPAVDKAVQHIHDNLHQDLSFQHVAKHIHIHPSYLSRLFAQEMGQPYSDYVTQQRMEQAKKMIEAGLRVQEAAASLGYQDPNYFSRVFRSYWGKPPTAFKS